MGVFHAMPISRAKSLMCSHWIRDMLEFYGLNIFMAETSRNFRQDWTRCCSLPGR